MDGQYIRIGSGYISAHYAATFLGHKPEKSHATGTGSLHTEQHHFDAYLQLYHTTDSPCPSGFPSSCICIDGFHGTAASVSKEKAPKAVAKVFIGVSAGMVLGVPVTSYIASEVSFTMGMMFFTVVNALVFMATLLFVPSMPVKEKLSYGAQLNVLKKKIIWYSIMAVTLINGALFGFFSYMSDYLRTVTEVSYSVISILLMIYGLANITGNVIAGKQLATNPIRSMIFIPFALFTFYICIFILGEWLAAMTVIILILGILAGYGQNTMQYMITEAAPEAPDFANGLFLLSANLGTTVGAAACGAFITFFDTRYSVIGSLLFLAVSIVFVVLRIRTVQSSKTMGLKVAA